uniref:Uncharacterized protein n=1 Tax=Panagrolaimus sp. ES5 TaxID=591445 RepID=A0AC34GUU5_9BILA
MSVDFDLTDIEDIDAISDEFDADPSSDDDTFISNKNKKITKKREKRVNVIKSINNNNGAQIIETFEKIVTKAEETEAPVKTKFSNFNSIQPKQNLIADSEDEKEDEKIVEKRTNAVIKLNGPTDHFNELEKAMNGPGWMITSSSATQSEDELGAFERDEFAFKMCQIIRRSGRNQEKRKKHHIKHEKIVKNFSEDTTTKTKTSTTEIQASEEESSDGENMLKYCSRDVPLAVLNEDEL